MISAKIREIIHARKAFLMTIAIWSLWIILAIAVRTFLFQPFNIPSRSMEPVLLVGDHLFVSKYAYGYSRYALPFQSGPVSFRLFAQPPERGDVVVFRPVRQNDTDYIKRVIGLPGDTIQVKGGQLYINGEYVPKAFAQDQIWRETLPNGKTHLMLDLVPNAVGDDTPIFTVPKAHVFVMGDNRDNSMDSRFMSYIGFVPMNNLIGRAEMIYFSIDWNQGWQIRWRRIGSLIE